MVDIIADLNVLDADGERIPVYIEGDAPETLPDEYFTVSEDYTSDNLNADNETKEILWEFTLKWYTKNMDNVFNGLLEAIKTLKKKNYIISGVGYHNSTYQSWYSRAVDVSKIENITEE
jgi:hypothetical protein